MKREEKKRRKGRDGSGVEAEEGKGRERRTENGTIGFGRMREKESLARFESPAKRSEISSISFLYFFLFFFDSVD